jgi:hypothetical protein
LIAGERPFGKDVHNEEAVGHGGSVGRRRGRRLAFVCQLTN